ncbi:MAG: MMPL family transporter [Thiohalophilus sp.]|uniref:MMPL family transporter n=1 Tax=Thiohalophilus sp. TaxID=3028392 RepID=UPI002870436B|nr:MMPL family transporter [Thiohalophilus sp.]MDR9435516.1 MMPL family transporter [Thiohalophilus sp.]
MNNTRSPVLHAIWLIAISLLLAYLILHMEVITDIKQFMPVDKEDGTFHALQSEILTGHESTSMLLNIHGANAERLVKLSRALREEVSFTEKNAMIRNGEGSFDTTGIEILEENRFLLVDTDWSVEGLKRAFQSRLFELRQGQGPVIGQSIKSDPYLSVKKYFELIKRPTSLDENYPVWYAEGIGAILRVDFGTSNIDLDTIERVQSTLRSKFQELSPTTSAKLEITGPGAIAVATRAEIQSVTHKLSLAIPLLLLLVFWVAYQSVYLIWFSVIPLITGALVGLVITQLIFTSIHGVVIAFGITMLGVALDYPVHLFSHKYKDEQLLTTAKRIWPVLRLGGLTSAIAFLVLLFSGFEGLSQLAVYAFSGLIIALLLTRYFLPHVVSSDKVKPRVYVNGEVIPPFSASVILVLIVLVVLFPWMQSDVYWNDSVDAVSPVSPEWKEQDARLRNVIGGIEVSDVFVLADTDLDRLLISTEQLSRQLNELVTEGVVKSVLPVTDFLPSSEQQQARQDKIPQSKELNDHVRRAVENMPFKASAFKEFVRQAERTKQQDFISYDEILRTPARPFVRQGLIEAQGRWLSVIRISGLSAPDRLMHWLDENPDVSQYHVNIKDQVSDLFALYRNRTLSGVYFVLAILAAVVFLHSKKITTSLRVISPVVIGVAGGLAAGLLWGEGLNIFHLMAVFLVIGMGLDYSLFFNHGRGKSAVFARSLHAVSVSAVTTVTLFLFLAFSAIPVLSAMGGVIVAGVFISFMTAWMISRIG